MGKRFECERKLKLMVVVGDCRRTPPVQIHRLSRLERERFCKGNRLGYERLFSLIRTKEGYLMILGPSVETGNQHRLLPENLALSALCCLRRQQLQRVIRPTTKQELLLGPARIPSNVLMTLAMERAGGGVMRFKRRGGFPNLAQAVLEPYFSVSLRESDCAEIYHYPLCPAELATRSYLQIISAVLGGMPVICKNCTQPTSKSASKKTS